MKLLIGLAVCWVVATAATSVGAQTAEALIRRGDYLVNGIAACGNCHSPQMPDGTLSGPPLSGGEALKQLAFLAYPPNLTPDVDTGLGTWTEDQIVTALREGHAPTGAIFVPQCRSHSIAVFPIAMPTLSPHICVRYLRSKTKFQRPVIIGPPRPATVDMSKVSQSRAGQKRSPTVII